MAIESRCSSSRFIHPNLGSINLFTLDGKKAVRGMPLLPAGDSPCCPLPERPAGARDRRGLPPLGHSDLALQTALCCRASFEHRPISSRMDFLERSSTAVAFATPSATVTGRQYTSAAALLTQSCTATCLPCPSSTCSIWQGRFEWSGLQVW